MPTSLATPSASEPLIASDKVEGTAVFDAESRRIGEIRNFMVNKLTGKVAFVVMSFGGFLGIGESHYPLPWEALVYSEELGGYVVSVDRDRLDAAPSYDQAQDPFVDPAYGGQVKEFWVT